MSILMNAAVIVSLADKASQGLNKIGDKFDVLDKKAKATRAQIERLDKIAFAGKGTALAGAAGFTTTAIAADKALDSASKLQDVMKSFEVNAFGKAIRLEASDEAIKTVLDQAQAIAKGKGIDLSFSSKQGAMDFIKKEALDLAEDLGDKTIFGKVDAVGAFDTLQKNGVKLEDVLTGAGAATMYLAQITKRAPEESADGISKMASAYQMTGKQVENLADLIVRADGASAASAQSIESGFKYSAGTAKTLNMAVEDLVVTLSSLNSRGVDESTAGTGLDQFLNKIVNQTGEGEKAMKRLGLSTSSFKDAKGNILPMQQIIDKLNTSMKGLDAFRQQEWLNTVFGDQGGRVAAALLKDGSGSIAEIRGQMANSLGLTERAEEANKGYTVSLSRMSEAWENLKITMGTPLLDKAANEIEYLTTQIGKTADYMENHPGLSKGLLIGGGVVSGLMAIGGILTITIATISKMKLIWGSAFSKKPSAAKDLDQITNAAEKARRTVQSIPDKKVDVGVNKIKVDQFVAWLKSQQWRKTVIVDYDDGVGGGSGGGSSKKKGTNGSKRRASKSAPSSKDLVPVDSTDLTTRGQVYAQRAKKPPALPAGKVEVLSPGGSERRTAERTIIDVTPNKITEAVASTGKRGWASGLGKGALKGMGVAGTAITAYHVVDTAMNGDLQEEVKKHGAEMALSTAGAWAGGALAAALGSVVPGAGTVLGGLIGASAGGWLGNNLGKWIDDKKWTENAYSWGANLVKSMTKGMNDKGPEIAQASELAARRIGAYLKVESPSEKGPLSTNHLWGGNLIQSFADGMVGKLPILEGASGAAAGAATFTGAAGVAGDRVGSGGITLTISEGAIQIQIDGSTQPEAVGKQVREELNAWSRTDLPRLIDQLHQKKQIMSATYRPGLVR